MRTRVLTLLAAATAAVAAPSVASAATIVGTLAGGLSGVKSSTGAVAPGVTFTNKKSEASDDGFKDFAPVLLGDAINMSAVTATKGSEVSFTSGFGNFFGTVQTVSPSLQGMSSVVSLYVLGNFTPSGSLSAFSKGAASITFSFTQTGGANSAISGSYTLASPPSGVPEPATWGMMIAGAGMAGAAVRRRRSTKVAAA